ncbi:MAG: PfkB family carbohydrate kinase [Acidobacteriota bacterium]
MSDRPVAVLADLVVDRFITGTPKRISREAPVLILRHDEERITPGGGANAIANIAALGGRPLPLGVVGDDASGHALLAELRHRGVPTDGIRVRAGYRTPTKTRILGGAKGAIKQQIVRYDVEDSLTLDDDDRAHFRATLERWPRARVAVLSDYGYGTVDPVAVERLEAELGPREERVLLLDSRFRLGELGAMQGVDGATPNEEEAEALHGGDLEPTAAGGSEERLAHVHRVAEALRERLGMRFLLITRGSRGMVLVLPGRSAHVPVHGTAQVADVTGAGDTVIGTFALALAAGAEPIEATVLANYAGGIVVMKMGTATTGPDELAAAVRSDPALLDAIRWAGS